MKAYVLVETEYEWRKVLGVYTERAMAEFEAEQYVMDPDHHDAVVSVEPFELDVPIRR